MRTDEVALCLLVALAVVGTALSPVLGAEQTEKQDLAFLLDGVNTISGPWWTGMLMVLGEQSFPLVCDSPDGPAEPVVAAARMGKGRAVAFADARYLGKAFLTTPEGGKLISNAVRWSAGEKAEKSASPVRVGVLNQPGLLAYLQEHGFKAEALDAKAPLKNLKAFNVICFIPSSFSKRDIKALAGYVRGGGGILAAEKLSNWLEENRGKNLTQYPGNLLLGEAGIFWGEGDRGGARGAECLGNARNMELYRVDKAIEYLRAYTSLTPKEDDSASVAQAVTTVARAIFTLPQDDKIILPQVKSLLENQKVDYADLSKHPITMKQPLQRLRATMDFVEIKRLPAKRVKAHPAATGFPGAIPDRAPRVTRIVQIDTARNAEAWCSTGLYAAPGEAIKVEAPAGVNGKCLSVRIGAHTDTLWDDEWRRMPEITNSTPLVSPRTVAANAFGGPIYIEVPEKCDLGVVSVTIHHAVEAPYYVRGRTDLTEWRDSIRNRPAPWAELEGDNIILTVPSTSVRKMDNPEEILKFWDGVLDEDADLAAIPRQRPYKERMLNDVQIGGGYMHSGYPIMTHLDVAEYVVDLPRLRKEGSWGHFHELGHNHQSLDWTFDATWEVTENLFTLYNYEFSCDSPPTIWPPEEPAEMIKKYLATGPDFSKWAENPFLGLLTYYQLKEAFGWDAYKRVFAEYRALPADQRPKSDDEKRDQWMVRFSRAVGRNLGPFFQAWAIPTSEQARNSISDLPVWMPENFPPK